MGYLWQGNDGICSGKSGQKFGIYPSPASGKCIRYLDYFNQLNDLPNVRFDLSFKYSQAHAHAAVKPTTGTEEIMETDIEEIWKTDLRPTI